MIQIKRNFGTILNGIFLAAASAILSTLTLCINKTINPRNSSIGDYFLEVDRIFYSFQSGDFFNFYDQAFIPIMMPFSIILRVGFGSLLSLIGLASPATPPGESNWGLVTEQYLLGVFAILFISILVISFGLLQNNLSRPRIILFSLAIAINPIVFMAIKWGHPEEILFASLIVAAALVLNKRRIYLGGVLLGLAIATKQPAVIAFFPLVFFVAKEDRLKFFFTTLVTVLVATIPWVATSWDQFIYQNLFRAAGQDIYAVRGYDFFSILSLSNYSGIGKPVIILTSFLLPFWISQRGRRNISLGELGPILIILFLLRSTLDVGNISYYLMPAGLSLMLIDITKEVKVKNWNLKNLPLLTLSISFLLLFFMNTVLSNSIDILQNNISFILLVTAIIFYLLNKIVDKESFQGLSRKKVYGSILLAISALFIIGFLTHQDPEKKVPPIGGFRSSTPEEVSKFIYPKSAYWLGQEKITNNIYLIQSAVLADINVRLKQKKSIAIAIISYGNKETHKTITITTFSESLSFNPYKSRCLFYPCKSKLDLFEISQGVGLIDIKSKYNWEVYLKTKNNQYITINNDGINYTLNDLEKDLKEIKKDPF